MWGEKGELAEWEERGKLADWGEGEGSMGKRAIV